MNTLRILLLDDAPEFAFAIDSILRDAGDHLPAPAEIVYADNVTRVRDLVAAGGSFSAALIDLGLGPNRVSGLGAIDILEKAHVPVVVHSEYKETIDRLMFVYAAFAWYRPLALIPKVGYAPGADLPGWRRKFASDLSLICRGKTLAPDLAAPFRPGRRQQRPFERIITSRQDLDKWMMFVGHAQTRTVATSLKLQPKHVEKWVAAKYDVLWELLAEAGEVMNTDFAQIEDPYTDGYKAKQSSIHNFARSQSWFFTDPVVRDRFRSS